MNEQLIKLNNVKKSCKGVKIVAKVLFIITLVATILTLGAGIVLMSSNDKFDASLQEGIDKGYISVSLGNGFLKYSESGETFVADIHSDIPDLQEAISNASLSFIFGLYCMIIAVICGLTAVPCYFFYSAFASIIEEETPFCDVVIKKLLTCFIVVSVIILLVSGTGFAVLSGFFTWAFYTILDYGRTLQIQSDETL